MKTRIISGIIMIMAVAVILLVGLLWNTAVITVTIALLAAGAVYELLHNAADIKSGICVFVSCLFAAVAVLSGYLSRDSFKGLVLAVIVYMIVSSIIILAKHNEFDLAKITAFYGFPVPFAVAFFALNGIITGKDGIYYLLLLFNFSSICDTGAYFTGVTFGKHKLCPKISPKKTVEGAVGGIISSVIFSIIISLCFGKFSLTLLALTVPFCVLGIIGDLFASVIKRSVGLKDYSQLIPGHGGIMDRLDSMIMIVPIMYLLSGYGLI